MTVKDSDRQDNPNEGLAYRNSRRSDARVALYCLGLVATMTGAAFAAVPLYDLFCRVTGFGGTTQRAETVSDQILDQTISVRFDANVANGLPWDFAPEAREVRLKIGESGLMIYVARNTSRLANSGTASFNVTPTIAGQYFVKVECFCFTEQELQAGESMDMPVAFYVDPDIVNDPDLQELPEITLSYTFFPDGEDEDDVAETEKPVGSRG
ncbi:MAG: cytochrome c oxidase assembly protein [Pseudomonadota bacterium]